jgi:hypothetical protein
MDLFLLSRFLLAEVEDLLRVVSWENGAISGGLCQFVRSVKIVVEPSNFAGKISSLVELDKGSSETQCQHASSKSGHANEKRGAQVGLGHYSWPGRPTGILLAEGSSLVEQMMVHWTFEVAY